MILSLSAILGILWISIITVMVFFVARANAQLGQTIDENTDTPPLPAVEIPSIYDHSSYAIIPTGPVCNNECLAQEILDFEDIPVSPGSRYTIFPQSTGKILAVVQSQPSSYITRFNIDGTVDTTFGVNGVVEDSLLFYTETTNPFTQLAYTVQISALAPDDSLYISFYNSWLDSTLNQFRFSSYRWARILPDGTIDTSYGESPTRPFTTVTESTGSLCKYVSNNKIVSYYSGTIPFNPIKFYNQDGTFDRTLPSFPGPVLGDTSTQVFDLVEKDGFLYFSAVLYNNSQSKGFPCVIKTDLNGNVDSTWADQGYAYDDQFFIVNPQYDFYNYPYVYNQNGMGVDDEGNIYLSGWVWIDNFNRAATWFSKFKIDGTVDRDWGNQGSVTWGADTNIYNEYFGDGYYNLVVNPCDGSLFLIVNLVDFNAGDTYNHYLRVDSQGLLEIELRSDYPLDAYLEVRALIPNVGLVLHFYTNSGFYSQVLDCAFSQNL